MLDKIAMGLTAVAIGLLVAAGFTKNETLMLLFLTVYATGMLCWGAVWLRQAKNKRRRKKQRTAPRNPTVPSGNAVKTETNAAETLAKPLLTLPSPDGEGYCVLEPDPHDKKRYTLSLYGKSGKLVLRRGLTTAYRRYLLSGLLFCMKTEGWPLWVLEGLYYWGGMSRFISDQGEVTMAGRVYWNYRGDHLYFEKKEGLWSVHSEMKKFSAGLPGATDEQITHCLAWPADRFYECMNNIAEVITGGDVKKLLLNYRCHEGFLTVAPTEKTYEFLLQHCGEDRCIAHEEILCDAPKQFTLSGLMFYLRTKGWPEWTLQYLSQWKDITRFTNDQAAPDCEGRIYWQNEGDLSRYYQILYFEKVSGQWQLTARIADPSWTKEMTYPLPDAADEDIAGYLTLQPKAFWRHPAILALHQDHYDSVHQTRPTKYPAIPDKIKVKRMLENLDQDLQGIGMDRQTLLKNLPGYGDKEFVYSAAYGYRLLVIPDRQKAEALCQHQDEAVFRDQVMEKARQIKMRLARREEAKRRAEERNALDGYLMSEEEKQVCARMEKRLDSDLMAMGVNRDFLEVMNYGPGKARFGYAKDQGYFYVVQPERMPSVVPSVQQDENAFIAGLLNEAAYYLDKYGHPDVLLTLKYTWGGKAEHGVERLHLVREHGTYSLTLISWDYSDAGGQSCLTGVRTRCVGRVNPQNPHKWRPSGFLFYAQTAWGLPAWAAEELAKEKTFRDIFWPGRSIEQPGQVFWCNWGDPQEHEYIWFRKVDGVWRVHSDVWRPDVRINKVTPLPEATNKDIAALLMLDSDIYVESPDIEHWYRRDPAAEVTLYRQVNHLRPNEMDLAYYVIDTRCGALYCYDKSFDSAHRDGVPGEHAAAYGKLARLDSRYEGMNGRNWRKYLPEQKKPDRNDKVRAWQEKSAAKQAAMATFSKAEQEQFEEQLYQYQQDVHRGGTEPEVAAANRNLVFVDGTPVPEKVARRMQELEAKKTPRPGKSVEIYRHDRKSFYDDESWVKLGQKSPEEYTLLAYCNTPNYQDNTAFDLPLLMAALGCTKGEILTWLKAQRCVIPFSGEALQDGTVVIPKPRLLMQDFLSMNSFGREKKVLLDKFYVGSSSQHKVFLRQKDGVTWLVLSAYWRDEHDPKNDRSCEMAIRDEQGVFMDWREQSLLKQAERKSPTLSQALLFSEVRVYHDEIDLSCYGKASKTLHHWTSSVGHDSQSWDCRRHDTTLHEAHGRWYVIDRTLWIDGTTQENKWITTIATLRPGEETRDAEEICKAIGEIPCGTPDSMI